MSEWISVEERLPEAPRVGCDLEDLTPVLVAFTRPNGRRSWAAAVYCPPKTVDASAWESGYVWDENNEDCWGEPGWYESREVDDESPWWRLDNGDRTITHWATVDLPEDRGGREC